MHRTRLSQPPDASGRCCPLPVYVFPLSYTASSRSRSQKYSVPDVDISCSGGARRIYTHVLIGEVAGIQEIFPLREQYLPLCGYK